MVKLGGEVSDLSEAMRLALQRGTDMIVERLAECVSQGCADGSLPPDLDADGVALNLYNQWLGATVLTKIRRDPSALDAAMSLTLALLQPSLTDCCLRRGGSPRFFDVQVTGRNSSQV